MKRPGHDVKTAQPFTMDEMLDTAVYTKLDRDMGEQKLNTWPTQKVLDAMQQERASLRKDVIEFRNKE
jgi:hypothetical protein